MYTALHYTALHDGRRLPLSHPRSLRALGPSTGEGPPLAPAAANHDAWMCGKSLKRDDSKRSSGERASPKPVFSSSAENHLTEEEWNGWNGWNRWTPLPPPPPPHGKVTTRPAGVSSCQLTGHSYLPRLERRRVRKPLQLLGTGVARQLAASRQASLSEV